MVKELDFLQIYHLKDMFLSAELFISCSVLQLTFYVICISYTRRTGFVILSQQIYHIGFLILFLTSFLIVNEELLFQTFLSINDYLSFISKFMVCVCSLFFIFIIKTSFKDDLMKHNFEYVVLILLGVLGSLLLCSANDLLTAYLAMELQSVAFYLMAAFKKNSNYSIESGLKYFIVGSFASALFLFGSSFIYGFVGSLNFDDFKLFLPLLSLSNVVTDNEENLLFLSHFFLSADLAVPFAKQRFEYHNIIFQIDTIVSFIVYYNDGVPLTKELPDWFLIENGIKICPTNLTPEEAARIAFASCPGSPGLFWDVYHILNLQSFSMQFPKYFNLFEMTEEYCIANSLNLDVLSFSLFSSDTSNSYFFCEILKEFYNSNFDGSITEFQTSFDLEMVYFGFMLVCLSLLIKLAIAPFHFWSLDVYEGSPNQSTFFFAVVPKIGLFVLLIRICYSGFYDFLSNWQFYFLILAVISIFVGSLGGLEQRKLKSLLAYSSISHSGYLLLSFSTNAMEGVQMMIYYIIIFMLSGLCFWSVYMFLRQKIRNNYYNKQNKELGDLVLLRESNPILALTLTLTLFSIAGIPPLVGFLAKLGIFLSALSSSTYVIALFSILLSVISTFYYIRVIKIVYFENVLTGKLYHSISTTKSVLVSVLFLSIILLCIYPMILYFVSHKAILLI